MRDLHVEWLLYSMEIAPTTIFENPPAVELELPHFRLTLRNAEAKLHLKRHCSTLDEAQASVAPFLRAWEIDVGLTIRPGEVRFVYKDCSIIDRNPPEPDDAQIVGLRGIASGVAFGVGGMISVSRQHYPEPPMSFIVTPTVEALWRRFEGYVGKREPLSSMAYFCLTVIESSVGKKSGRRNAAAKQYNIDAEILWKLAHLTERRGDPMTARKMETILIPHSNVEVQWIETTVKAMIRRVGEVAAGASVQQIRMRDLPTL